MGTDICAPVKLEGEFELNSYAFEYGEDTHEALIVHEDTIKSRVSEIEPILFDCQ